jgi:glycosyltransferase involved in cell wall biosynthesis
MTRHDSAAGRRASGRRYRILTWHVHGNYLYYLTQAPHDFFVLSKPDRPPGYSGRVGTLPWGENLHDCPVSGVQDLEFDCILFQSREHYLADQHEILSPRQRRLPKIFLEHDPPQQHPTNTRHPAEGADLLVVHVTPFNQLMWDNGATPTRVIDHGVTVPPGIAYSGEIEKGVVVVNHLQRRGRRLGADVFRAVREDVPLELYGMAADELDGAGELPYARLLAAEARYRFFFHPVRYTSLGLAVCEAMMLGMPVVGLATTELPTVIANGESGYVDTDPRRLVEAMRWLLGDVREAKRLGANAKRYAEQRFGIERFVRDWNEAFATVVES